jgi:hypothetical protein
MATGKRPLGFGDKKQAAEFFGISQSEVLKKASSGEWPSYVIGGRRVFDLDAILDSLVRGHKDACGQQEAKAQ